MLGTQLLFDAVGPQALDRTAHEELRLVERIPKRIAGIAEHHEVAGLAHEGGHVADIAMNDDVDALHRDAAARCRIALDDKEAAAAGCAGILAGIALDDDCARHHVFRNAWPCRTVNGDGPAVVHPGAIIADGPLHVDRDGRIDADGNRMAAARIDDFEGKIVRTVLDVVQGAVEFTQRRSGKINDRHVSITLGEYA